MRREPPDRRDATPEKAAGLVEASWQSVDIVARRVISWIVSNDTTTSDARSDLPSGRFVLRIDPGLHGALKEAAQAAGTSLNEYCARKLALPMSSLAPAGAEAIARAAALAGDALLGVVAFGSWARQELAQKSDVDLLIVVDAKLDIGRRLYREWDDRPLTWGGHPVQPHFVHPPRPGERISGTWAEIALDGVVLFERGLAVSRWLVELRRKIVAGELIRRRIHGQSYWVQAA